MPHELIPTGPFTSEPLSPSAEVGRLEFASRLAARSHRVVDDQDVFADVVLRPGTVLPHAGLEEVSPGSFNVSLMDGSVLLAVPAGSFRVLELAPAF